MSDKRYVRVQATMTVRAEVTLRLPVGMQREEATQVAEGKLRDDPQLILDNVVGEETIEVEELDMRNGCGA